MANYEDMKAQMKNSATRPTPRFVAASPIAYEMGGNADLRAAQERSNAFLANRLRARQARNICGQGTGPARLLVVDFSI